MEDFCGGPPGWAACFEQRRRERFIEYLKPATPRLLEAALYAGVKRAFVQRNAKRGVLVPGALLSAEQAYFEEGDAREETCALSPALLELLFRLQYVGFSDAVQRDTPRRYKALRTYHVEDNRAALRALEEKQGNWYVKRMVAWACRQQPIRVAVHVDKRKRYKPPGELVFYIHGCRLLDPHEPIVDDHSSYEMLDVYASGECGSKINENTG